MKRTRTAKPAPAIMGKPAKAGPRKAVTKRTKRTQRTRNRN